MSAARPILQAENLTVQRGSIVVLDIPELSVLESEFLCLIGPNGAGKSSLMQALCCLLPHRSGRIFFDGHEICSRSQVLALRRSIAMVFQEPLLFDTTVYANVAAGLKIRGASQRETARIVGECLERFRIAHLAGRSARKLSGGEAQRTSLARAFAVQPRIIFLDEPFSSLDPPARDGLIDDLEQILGQTRVAMVMASHDRMETLRLSDRLAFMRDGRIVQVGRPADVMNRPIDEAVASFVGMEVVIEGIVARSDRGVITAAAGGQYIEAVGEARADERVLLCIRPESVTLSPGIGHEKTSARNFFAGTIKRIMTQGHVCKVNLDCGFFLSSYLTCSSVEDLGLHEGMQVGASFKATAVHVIKK